MFKRFILATDLSGASNALAESLGGLKTLGAEACLLVLALPQETDEMIVEFRRDVIDKRLQAQKEMLEKLGYRTEIRIVMGAVRRELNRIAVEEGYALIVAGAEKHSLTTEILSGRLAYDIVHHAEKPLLIVRLAEDPETGFEAVSPLGAAYEDPILFATDFSENSGIAFEYLEGMVVKGFRNILLWHIQDKRKIEPYLEDMLEDFQKEDLERLEELKRRLAGHGNARIEIMMKYGNPALEIVKLAEERRPQLILMGSQGSGFIRELYLGSVSHNVARQAPANVLLIPARREEA
jgi:nucleotide-binding universal stress UspA family protein